MTAREIVNIIEKTAPPELAYSWDNSGFLCGDINRIVKSIYLTLDVNMYTVDEAVKAGADMIISHHPIMLGGIKNIDYSNPHGYVIKQLIENNIALYAAHTSMDCAKNGINHVLAQKLGITDEDIMEKNESFPGCGLGLIGSVAPLTLREFAQRVKEALETPFVRICGDSDTVIKKAAVGSGSCGDLVPIAKKMGADVMVTSDIKYHLASDSVESGICLIDAGHYPTEKFVTDIFAKLFEGYDVKLIISSAKDVFTLL